MKYKLQLTIGQMGLEIEDDASDFTEFVRKMDLWSSLPSTGPNGETDLEFRFRTPRGYKYYSIACPSAGVEMRLHQFKERPGDFYTQSWTKITYGAQREDAAGAEELEKESMTDQDHRDAQEQERKHREADEALKSIFLATKGQTEATWKAYYIEKDIADWSLEEKHRKIETGRASLAQRTTTKLRTAIAELAKHVDAAEIEQRIAKVCAGEFEVDRLNPAEQAKALKSLEMWIEEALQSKSQRRSA